MRIGYSDEEDYPGQFELWQANCLRSLQGKKGQTALRELEAALLALPEKRLIAEKLEDSDGQVCALGALAKHKGHSIPAIETEDEWWDESGHAEEMEEFGVSLGMPRLVAWKVVAKNDIEIDGHYVNLPGPYRWFQEQQNLRAYVPVTPEIRYQKMLAWVQRQIQAAASSEASAPTQ